MQKLHAVNEIQLNFLLNQTYMQQSCTLVVSFDKSKQKLHCINEIQLKNFFKSGKNSCKLLYAS
jgi:hypothetical protein